MGRHSIQIRVAILLWMLLLVCHQSLVRCACPDHVTVGWQLRPPFVLTLAGSGDLYGSVASPLETMLSSCCPSDVTISYVDLNNVDTEPLLMQNFTILMPVPRSLQQSILYSQVTSRRFVATQQGGGAVFVSYPITGSESNALVSVFTQGWPFLLLIIIVALYGALLIWICDSYWNPQHFPAFCLTGVWEGIWWAIVSMTTVGYGDRIPRSFVARIISIIVILQGLVICTLFTAGVTSVVSNTEIPSVEGKTVGVLRDSVEFQIAMTHDAYPREYNSVAALMDDVLNNTIRAALLDSYQWRYFMTERLGDIPQLHSLSALSYFKTDTYYGLVTKDVDDGLWQCMSAFAMDTELQRAQLLRDGWAYLESRTVDINEYRLQNVLSFDNSLVTGTIAATSIWLLVVVVITIIQCIYYKKRNVSIASLFGTCNYNHQNMSKGYCNSLARPKASQTKIAQDYNLTSAQRKVGDSRQQSSPNGKSLEEFPQKALSRIDGF